MSTEDTIPVDNCALDPRPVDIHGLPIICLEGGDVPRTGVSEADTCLNIGDAIVGQTSRSLMPCDLSSGKIIDFIPAQLGEPVVPCASEDDPCWNCATMGNHVCGTKLTTSTIVSLPSTGLRDPSPILFGGGALVALGTVLAALSRRVKVTQ